MNKVDSLRSGLSNLFVVYAMSALQDALKLGHSRVKIFYHLGALRVSRVLNKISLESKETLALWALAASDRQQNAKNHYDRKSICFRSLRVYRPHKVSRLKLLILVKNFVLTPPCIKSAFFLQSRHQ